MTMATERRRNYRRGEYPLTRMFELPQFGDSLREGPAGAAAIRHRQYVKRSSIVKATIVCGGQYGSEGKGNVAGELHKTEGYDWGIRVGGPNAGHTIYDHAGSSFALRQIPVAAAVDPYCKLGIAEGSEIDIDVLKSEITALEASGHQVADRLYIHPDATIISNVDKARERDMPNGSTQKGIGAARAARAMRAAATAKDVVQGGLIDPNRVNPARGERVLIEGTQGFALGSHAGGYPHCTSGDCRAIDFAAQAGLTLFDDAEVWVVLRTYPIRIAGNSGPLESEMTWEQVGVPAEFTTVTKKMRRVGDWDQDLAKRAIRSNGGRSVKVALTFADYWWPEIKGAITPSVLTGEQIHDLVALQDELEAEICMLGTGPSSFIHLDLNTEGGEP